MSGPGTDAEQPGFLNIADRSVHWITLEVCCDTFQNPNICIPYNVAIYLCRLPPRALKSLYPPKTHKNSFSSVLYNVPKLETIEMSTNGRKLGR